MPRDRSWLVPSRTAPPRGFFLRHARAVEAPRTARRSNGCRCARASAPRIRPGCKSRAAGSRPAPKPAIRRQPKVRLQENPAAASAPPIELAASYYLNQSRDRSTEALLSDALLDQLIGSNENRLRHGKAYVFAT